MPAMKRTSTTNDALRHCLGGAILTLALSCASGCGNARDGVVTGKVTHQGKTLASGTVVLFGEDNQPVQAPIGPDGAYRIHGAPYGLARLAVFSPGAGKPLPARTVKDKIKAPPPSAPDTSKWFPIPDIYTNPETSGLTLRLEHSETRFDIDLP
jgi:hypothetical protein